MEQTSIKKENTHSGHFIALEGIDGSGKSTQITWLAKRLKEEGIRHYTTMEPTKARIGSFIRQILTGQVKADPRVIAALFAADRLDHLLNETDGILAKIKDGTTVITDRYYFSSYAYHSVDVPMEWVIQTNEQSSILLKPTITIFIDIDPDIALDRISKNRATKELFEERSRLIQVRENYFKAFERLKETEKVVIIDGTQTQEQIAQAIWDNIKNFFPTSNTDTDKNRILF